MTTDWISRFPEMNALPDTDKAMLTDKAVSVSLPEGTVIFAPGMPAEQFLLVLDGTVRVQQVSANGREIVLYRVTGGESCIMTTACLLSEESYAAEGITETAVDAIAIPKTVFEDALATSAAFRRLVFTSYSQRIAGLMHVIEEVAFERLDKRLARRLLDLADDTGSITATHQVIATELGSAREVVGRLLKELERRNLVRTSRGRIDVLDTGKMRALAESD